jgi:hypothetical protein
MTTLSRLTLLVLLVPVVACSEVEKPGTVEEYGRCGADSEGHCIEGLQCLAGSCQEPCDPGTMPDPCMPVDGYPRRCVEHALFDVAFCEYMCEADEECPSGFGCTDVYPQGQNTCVEL